MLLLFIGVIFRTFRFLHEYFAKTQTFSVTYEVTEIIYRGMQAQKG